MYVEHISENQVQGRVGGDSAWPTYPWVISTDHIVNRPTRPYWLNSRRVYGTFFVTGRHPCLVSSSLGAQWQQEEQGS